MLGSVLRSMASAAAAASAVVSAARTAVQTVLSKTQGMVKGLGSSIATGTKTAASGGKNAAGRTGSEAAKTVPEIKSGIYVINASDGVYVGQSINIARRLAQHVRSGRFTTEEVSNVARQSVDGGRSAREVAEQTMIDRMGGIDNLLIEVNPIGPKRFELMPVQPYWR